MILLSFFEWIFFNGFLNIFERFLITLILENERLVQARRSKSRSEPFRFGREL